VDPAAGSRILAVAVGVAYAATLSLLVASSASAATTLHEDKQVSSTFRGPNGQPLGPNAVPTVGDSFDNTDLYYVGNHKASRQDVDRERPPRLHLHVDHRPHERDGDVRRPNRHRRIDAAGPRMPN
jgi:hypothetical protein